MVWRRARLIFAAIGLLLLAIIGYGAWRFGHPPMPAGSQSLVTGAAPSGEVTARFFGTTTLAFSDGRKAVMVDALLSRPDIRTALFGKLRSDPGRIDAILHSAALPRVDLLLISHTHFDHVLDAAAIAARTGATVVGSASTREVLLGGGVSPERIVTIGGGEHLQSGDFRIAVFRSLHSRGDRVPGEVTAPLHQPASVRDYREGGTYAYLIEHGGLSILVQASANFVPGMYHGVHADVVFLATGGLSTQPADFTSDYWNEVVGATGARLVVPIHWDDFFEPLDRPLRPFRRFMDDIPLTMRRIAPLAARDHVAVRYMPVIAPVDLGASVRRYEGRQ